MSTDHNEATRLADELDKWARDYATTDFTDAMATKAAALLRQQAEQIDQLRAEAERLRAVVLRMAAGINHLSEIARQWEPDHSSGADRRGWVLAKNARNDALKLLKEHAARTTHKETE